MKRIVQSDWSDLSKSFSEISYNFDFLNHSIKSPIELDVKTYHYFLEQYKEEIRDYLKSKHNIELFNTDTNDSDKKVMDNLEYIRTQNKYWKKFLKRRHRFYLYKGNYYFYVAGGTEKEPIVLFRLNEDEVLEILNKINTK